MIKQSSAIDGDRRCGGAGVLSGGAGFDRQRGLSPFHLWAAPSVVDRAGIGDPDLIAALGWHDPAGYIDSPLASADALARFHRRIYRRHHGRRGDRPGRAGGARPLQHRAQRQSGFPEIFQRPATAAGASILAARMLAGVAGGTIYSPAGGTIMAVPIKPAGFAYFNDPVLAILTLRDAGIAPILYVDLDAHHGDGVEAAFAADDQVLTVSIHEEGRWPGPASAASGPVARPVTCRCRPSSMTASWPS